MGRWLQALLGVAVLVAPTLGQVSQSVLFWQDVCTAAAFLNDVASLCPNTFLVSELAYSPNSPLVNSTLTLILRPAIGQLSAFPVPLSIQLSLPGFVPLGPTSPTDLTVRNLNVTGMNPVATGQDPLTIYNSNLNPVFAPLAPWSLKTGTLTLNVPVGRTLRNDVDTVLSLCCVILPGSSPPDNSMLTITMPKSDPINLISTEPIKNSPFIDSGKQFSFLYVRFIPPTSGQPSVVALTARVANTISNQARVILSLPGITFIGNQSMETAGLGYTYLTFDAGSGTDWMLFQPQAVWNYTASTLTWFLMPDQVWVAGRQVTLSTMPGDFRLPLSLPPGSTNLTVEARSFDNLDEVIRVTPVSQSSAVPPIRTFSNMRLNYSNNGPLAVSDVNVTFSTNRPCFAGSAVYIRLSGFQADVVNVVLSGPTKNYFTGAIATFLLPLNVVALRVNRTIYSNEVPMTLTLTNLTLPPSLYENDPSLLMWNSDPGSVPQSIDVSPMVGGGKKTFIRSQITFNPAIPRLPSNITFTIQPSIVFYEGDRIILHLFGFTCDSSTIPLYGADASRVVGSAAQWNSIDSTLVLTVAADNIISNVHAFQVNVSIATNFRLPAKLALNDGILRLEGQGALILKEPFRKVPPLGGPKVVIYSSILFEPVDQTIIQTGFGSISRITFSIILNSDVLPNSTIFIKLGGLLRDPPGAPTFTVSTADYPLSARSGFVTLSGSNAPLFVNSQAYWDQNQVLLKATMIADVGISAGFVTTFFIEQDQYFRLPRTTYPNDPTFTLAIPEAGIAVQPFLFSNRISQEVKQFTQSLIYYNQQGSAAFPNSIVEINMRIRPNVNIPPGSLVLITLPNFYCPNVLIPITKPQQILQVGQEYNLVNDMPNLQWDQTNYQLQILIPSGRMMYNYLTTIIRITQDVGFRLPSVNLDENDKRITLRILQNFILYQEPFRQSPRVVARTFLTSNFYYKPALSNSIFQFKMELQPSVNLTNVIQMVVFLPGFRNSLSKQNIGISGPDRSFFVNSACSWNETTSQMIFRIAPGMRIPGFYTLQLQIDESQGFILPNTLDANDTRLQLWAFNLTQQDFIIKPESVRYSPMVGDGPFTGHMFCMYQYEMGVRTGSPICASAGLCNPPLTDPCSTSELMRCGCEIRLGSIYNLTIQGFNLLTIDEILFTKKDSLCPSAATWPTASQALTPFVQEGDNVLSADGSKLSFTGMTSLATGNFRICTWHNNRVFDVGTITVRPACTPPKVHVQGVCVASCPSTRIPVAGDCVFDASTMNVDPQQAMAIAIEMADPYASSTGSIATRFSTDPEQMYFTYRFTYELSTLLNADPKRIKVASLSNGSVIVYTVFMPVGLQTVGQTIAPERTPASMASLVRAMQNDTSSAMYVSGSFFQNVARSYIPPALPVRLCPNGNYGVLCPYMGLIMPFSQAIILFIVGVLLLPLILTILCCGAWRIGADMTNRIDESTIEKLEEDVKSVDLQLQIEYARSWLEGRFVGEEWQLARQKAPLAVKGG